MYQFCTPWQQDKGVMSGASVCHVPRFSTLSLSVVWTLGFIASLTAGVLADVFQASAPVFPLGPVANLALGFNGLCALLSIFIGYSLWDSYSLYQPFAGGEHYVLLQFSGWTTVSICSVLMAVYLLQLQPPAYRYGALTILEGFASVGNVFLVVSLRFFASSEARKQNNDDRDDVQQPQGVVKGEGIPFLRSTLHSPNSESGLVVIFVLLQMLLCSVGAMFRSVSWLAMLMFIGFHIMCGFLIHAVIKWEHKRGCVLLTGPMETLYFVLSSMSYLAALAGGFALLRTGADAPQMVFGVTAFAAFVGVSSMLVLARTMRFEVRHVPFHAVVVRYARFALSAIAVMMVGFAIGITYYVKAQGDHCEQTVNDRAWINSLLFCQTLVVLFLLILSPVTHLTGHVIYGEAFSFFQPFRGSVAFVVLQGLGWSFFSVAIFCVTFHMTATGFRWILFASATGIMGQFFIQLSIEAFSSSSLAASGQPMHNVNDVKLDHKEQGILNGELIVSFLLQLTSFILHLVVDISVMQHENSPFIQKNVLIGFACLAFLVSVPLAHFSGTDKGIPLFRPFQGSGTYVALQALGWTMYSLFALKSIIRLLASANGVSSLYLIPERPPMLWFTLESLLQTVPHLLIVLSIIVEVRAFISRPRKYCSVLDALGLIKGELEKHLETHTLSEQKDLQLSLQTLAQVSLSAHGIVYDRRHFRFTQVGAAAANSSTEATVEKGRIDDDDDGEDDVFSVFLNGTEVRHGAAALLVLILCFASATGYIIAALWSSTIPLVGLVFTVAGFAVCTTSCVSAHCVYGALLHDRTGTYTFLMPFKGGPVFVALQIAGWVSYACTVLATLMYTLDDIGSQITLPIGALFSVSSQLLIFCSIPKFDARRRRQTYLEENGEGVVAMLVFLGAFFFAHLYLHVQRLFSERGDTDFSVSSSGLNTDAYIALTPRRVKLPFFLSVLSMVVTVPFLLITLNRSAKRWEAVAKSSIDRAQKDDMDDDRQRERRRSLIAVIGVQVAEIMMLLLSVITPMTFAFSAYYMLYSHHHDMMRMVQYLFPLKLVAGVIVLMLSLAPHAVCGGLRGCVDKFKHFFVTCFVYSIATVSVMLICLPALLLPFHSVGAYYSVISSVVLGVGATFPQVRTFIRFSMYAVLGYATYLAYLRAVESETVLSAIMTLRFYAVDVVQLLWWLWYLPSYEGRPEESGAHRSLTFTRWAQKHLFANMEKYFDLRIILDDEESVNLRDCNNRYIFSFHPHGVFSGTALVCTYTNAWREKIGENEKCYVATHAASVIFNSPLVRDFNLRLGALSVTRSAIASNLARGNSSIIVTGGQAELLLTQRSTTVMSLVTYHLGFVRLALRHKVPLVPLLCFAEQNVLDILHFPRLQRATLRLLGFPFPIIPYGRLLLPLPDPVPLVLVVGSAVPTPPGADPDNPKDVEALADVYFSSLRELFYKHRAEAGYPNMDLVLHRKAG